MQLSQQRVSRALDALTVGLYPFVERELKVFYKERWHDEARSSFRDDYAPNAPRGDVMRWDAHALLTVMWDQWNRVFRHKLGQPARSLTSELRDFRNRWAHQEAFGFDDTYRILDSTERLLRAVDSDEQAERMRREKHDLMRAEFSREARQAHRKAQATRRERLDLCIYAVCCVSIVAVIGAFLGLHYWYFAVFVVLIFAFLAYQRSTTQPQIFFGPHECLVCAKIIYGETCPYCEGVSGAPRQLVSVDSQRGAEFASRQIGGSGGPGSPVIRESAGQDSGTQDVRLPVSASGGLASTHISTNFPVAGSPGAAADPSS